MGGGGVSVYVCDRRRGGSLKDFLSRCVSGVRGGEEGGRGGRDGSPSSSSSIGEARSVVVIAFSGGFLHLRRRFGLFNRVLFVPSSAAFRVVRVVLSVSFVNSARPCDYAGEPWLSGHRR